MRPGLANEIQTIAIMIKTYGAENFEDDSKVSDAVSAAVFAPAAEPMPHPLVPEPLEWAEQAGNLGGRDHRPDAAFADGEREQRVDQLLLLFAEP